MAFHISFSRHRPTTQQPAWKRRLYSIIFKSDTRGGKAFDVALLITIGLSVAVVMLESVESIRNAYPVLIQTLEWTFTILFTCEYIARLLCVRRPLHYIWSFYGIIDLFAFLPSYINLVIPTANYLLTIRVLRLLRVFRILKLSEFMQESETLMSALYASRRKIAVFISTVLAIVLIMGTVMYLVEGEKNGFNSIPRGVYWAVVTLTTVGYGDVTPHTVLGRILACFIMIMGYGIIAVPSGIFSLELHQAARGKESRACANCGTVESDRAARFCRRCGTAGLTKIKI
ncbi:MAG TPA: ion transporter [Chthoniobacterales bacterium]|jgi:voltage-gated potassium channel